MIWVDSSFAVEWLAGTNRSKEVSIPKEALAILQMQYAEAFAFFLKKGHNPITVANELETLDLRSPEKIHLQQAGILYLQARSDPKSKASLSDALLAATAKERHEKILAFDQDFADLGFKEDKGIWSSL